MVSVITGGAGGIGQVEILPDRDTGRAVPESHHMGMRALVEVLPMQRAAHWQVPRPAVQVGARQEQVESAAVPEPAPETKPVAELVPLAERATILTLTERTCKWPIGDPTKDDFYFCGHPSDPGVPYCGYHCRIAYQPVNDRRRDRDRRSLAG